MNNSNGDISKCPFFGAPVKEAAGRMILTMRVSLRS